jgi:hypothetical protein
MPEQVLQIQPEHELKFKGPFTVPTTSLLKLTNPSDRRICFKIKTTAPKRYCVRPNAGTLEPKNSINIAVVFQPCELEPTANKHKFMVQALYAPDGDFNMDALWKDVDGTKLMDTKLRCTFEIPADGVNQNDLNAVPEDKVTRSKEEDVTSVKSLKVHQGPESDAAQNDFSDTVPYTNDSVSDEGRGSNDSSRVIQESLQLRQENSTLKDEIYRLKQVLKSREQGGNMAVGTNASPPAVTMLWIVAALVAAIFGLILGKFIL